MKTNNRFIIPLYLCLYTLLVQLITPTFMSAQELPRTILGHSLVSDNFLKTKEKFKANYYTFKELSDTVNNADYLILYSSKSHVLREFNINWELIRLNYCYFGLKSITLRKHLLKNLATQEDVENLMSDYVFLQEYFYNHHEKWKQNEVENNELEFCYEDNQTSVYSMIYTTKNGIELRIMFQDLELARKMEELNAIGAPRSEMVPPLAPQLQIESVNLNKLKTPIKIEENVDISKCQLQR